jgi:hypothetical protein
MLLQKIFTLNWIDDSAQLQKFTYLDETKASAELSRLKEEGFEAWVTATVQQHQNRGKNAAATL